MQLGRRDMKETDAALMRSEKVVNDTMAIGIQTAETLQSQTRQLEKVGAWGAARRPAAAVAATCDLYPGLVFCRDAFSAHPLQC